jgi:pSer/pThr/pTyr-binding forkhead associated (FHA) protein
MTTLRIVVSKSERQVAFSLPIQEIHMGRRDSACGISPDLDLAPDGGFLEGVSRQHAKIIQLGNRLLVEDTGSANGTFLDDECIKPYLLYPLREGTTLQLGGIQLLVEFD